MPRTETIVRELFKFEELSEKAQDKVLEKNWDWNVDSIDWWDGVYMDAATIGLTIEEFDLGGSKKIDGKLTESLLDCCKLIRKNHGKDCDTFKTAKQYLTEYIEAFKKWKIEAQEDGDTEDWGPKDWLWEFDRNDRWAEAKAEEITNDFRKALLEDYFSMLDREYDYLTSREAVIESIKCNEMEFQEDGSPA